LKFIAIAVRRATKPACISALMQRAGARLAIGRPHLRVALGEVFGDSDVLPDLEAAAAGRQAESGPFSRSTAAGRPQ
jgi:hypothetical protein